jgi:6-pyruvoyltetrahydropterin/6-carboxytetrahydropterin synthase
MYYLRTEGHFDGAHFLKDYDGKCSNLHGHRWKVVVEIQGKGLQKSVQERGMLVDFGDLKKAVNGICDRFDHCLVFEKGSLKEKTLEALREENFRMEEVPFRPTAENFARYFYEKLENKGYDMHRVEVYETPTNCAIYEEEA